MGILHPELKKALREGKAFAVFEMDDPGGTTYRYAGNWVASASLGKYKGFIPKNGFGPSPRSVPLRGDRLQPASTHVTIIDEDGAINTLLTGSYGRRIRGMDARIKIVAYGIPAEAYYTRFSGKILDYGKSGDKFRFDLGPRLEELEGYLRVPIVTKAVWPNADESATGQVAPIVYGVHSSASLGSRGMLPTLYVDNVNFKYLVGHQHLETISNVYVDHVVQSSGWTTEYVTRDGHRYTLIDFTADQGDAVITVDAKGGVFSGDISTYDELTNPAQQMKYILANYSFNEWDGTPTNWHDEAADDSPIAWELFENAEQFFNNRGVKGAIGIAEPITGLSLLNNWAKEYCPVLWTSDAKVAVRTDDWYFTYDEWVKDRVLLKENEHFLGPFNYDFDSSILADEWSVGFLYSVADGEALERIRVKDTARGWNIKEEIDLTWSESSV